LGLGLASTTFWTQFVMLIYPNLLPKNTCTALSSGGSRDGAINVLLFEHNHSNSKGKSAVDFYFDSKCKKQYIAETYEYQSSPKSESATMTYTGVTGFKLGKFDLAPVVAKKGKNVEVSGIGTFTPSSGAAANIGFACEIVGIASGSSDADAKSKKTTIPCSYGIAQKFPSLGQSLASLTTMKLKSGFSGKSSVAFVGEQSETVTSPDKLTVTSPAIYKLAISGNQQKSYGTAAPQGSSATYALFPPPPTSWSIQDKAHDIAFSTAVTDNKTRGSKGAITQISTGKTLATFTVDQSGTGSIKYSDGSTAAITSWILSN
jgi:hypothetical protein